MTRLRSLPLAIGALAVSAGVVAAFTVLPSAATNGLDKASDASGRTVPARPADVPAPAAQDAADAEAVTLPDAAGHGTEVSTVATGEDATPDTNCGADVSAAAKDNHGQTVAASHRPATAGKPEGAGPPEDVGKPGGVGKPDGAGRPEGAGQPEDPGMPADPGAPDGAGKPEGIDRP